MRFRRPKLLLVVALSGGIASACARKAPDPTACLTSALRVHGATPERYRASPEIQESVQEWTVDCLTYPFANEFLACIDRYGPSSVCQRLQP